MSVRTMQLPRMSDQTRVLWAQLAGKIRGPTMQGLDFLGNLASGDPNQFAQMEAPALRQFGQLQGDWASRFSGAGSGGRRSSGFQNVMTSEATDLAERLASNRMGLQQGAINQLMSLYEHLMSNDPYQTFHYQKEPIRSLASRLGGGFKGALSGAISGMPLGPWGAAAGGLFGGLSGMF